MTINSATRKTNNLVGNGNTATYPFAFKVFTDADVVVKKLEVSTSIETTLTLGANNDYIVTLNEDQSGNPGGSITLKSGGNNQNLASGFQLVITSAVQPIQGTDLTNQGGFFPEVINDALDKAIILHQQQQDEIDRSIKFSLTNTIGSLEITENATARANKVLAFDSAGEFEVLQELGTYRGNWAASTAYAVRDLVKDTSTGNIFFCNTAHTSSGAQPLTTNTHSANWDLIVDAATATTSATNAASSATSATASAATATTKANTATTQATTATTKASEAATSATSAATSASTATTQASNAATSATNAASSATAAAASAAAAASSAANTTFSATGDIAANNVQDAINELDTEKVPRTGTTGSAKIPSGTTAQRDGSPAVGFFRHNSTLNQFEGYNNGSWGAIGGGAGSTGGGTDEVFFESDQNVTTNYTLSANKHAHTVSPTINNGVTITVPSGAKLVIL